MPDGLTDRDRILDMLRRIDFTPGEGGDGSGLNEYKIDPAPADGSKVTIWGGGYDGFFSLLTFDARGTLIGWENFE